MSDLENLEEIKEKLRLKSSAGIARAVAAVTEKSGSDEPAISSSWADSCPSDNEYEDSDTETVKRPHQSSPTQEKTVDIQTPIFFNGEKGKGIASLSVGSLALDKYIKELDGPVTAEDLHSFLEHTHICWDHHIFRKRSKRGPSKTPQFLGGESNCRYTALNEEEVAVCYHIHGIPMKIKVKDTVYPFIIIFGRQAFFDAFGSYRMLHQQRRYESYYLKDEYIERLVQLYNGEIPVEWVNVIEKIIARNHRTKKPINSAPKRVIARPTAVKPAPPIVPIKPSAVTGPSYSSVAAGKVIPVKPKQYLVKDFPDIYKAACAFDDDNTSGNYTVVMMFNPSTASIKVTLDVEGDSAGITSHVRSLKNTLRESNTTVPIKIVIKHNDLSHDVLVTSA